MKGFAALATAAILVVQIAALLFVGVVSADHAVTITPDRTKVKRNWSGVLTITVANAGPDAIKSVQLVTVPSGWTDFDMVRKVAKDNLVSCVTDTRVVLPAGTVVWLVDNAQLVLTENTRVVTPVNSTVTNLTRNETKVVGYELNVQVPADVPTENVENLGINDLIDNFQVAGEVKIDIMNVKLKLLQDTYVVGTGNVVKLPENAKAVLVDNVINVLLDNKVTPVDNITVTLTNNVVRLVSPIPSTVAGWGWMEGDNLQLANPRVIVLPGTVVQFVGSPNVLVPDNTLVIREAGTQVDVTEASVENVPKGWSQDVSTKTWTGIGDNKIPANGSENFPFAIAAPTAAGTYTFYVRTTDTAGLGKNWMFTITVDNSISVDVTVDKTWVGKNENITITVKSTEPFWFDNVIVRENNGENVSVKMSTTDNMTYTGVYTTGENENRDGYLTIVVLNARDEVGNTIAEVVKDKLVFVDRKPPAAPSLKLLEIPTGIENISSKSINVQLGWVDDNLDFQPEGYSPENLTLEVLLDNQVVASGKADATGYVSFTITLTEGKHTIGARIIDKAGNVGAENVDNVYIDLSPPQITPVQPTKGALLGKKDVPENKLTITVKLKDTVLGIENIADFTDVYGTGKYPEKYPENENFDRGYVVLLYKDGELKGHLVPKIFPTIENAENVAQNVFGITAEYTFENVLDLAQYGLEGKYNVVICAGDSMGYAIRKGPHRAMENIAFEVDVSPPAKPSEVTGTFGAMAGTSVFEPAKTSKGQVRLIGKAEPRATIQVWISVEGGAWTELSAARTTADEEGSWSTIVDLTANKGKSVGIKVRAVDKAGNEGEFYTYGYVLFDDSRPIVKIKPEHKQITTDKASVLIEGTIQIDGWETYDEITVRVSPSTAAINFDRATGKFTVSAPVTEGTNLITVEAVDPVGNVGSDTAIITRTVTPWATYATILVVIALVLAAVAIFRKK